MDEYEFSIWQSDTSAAEYTVLSPGVYYQDSGDFYVPYKDTWYIVFLNKDSDQETTTVSITVNIEEVGKIYVDNVDNSYSTRDQIIIS